MGHILGMHSFLELTLEQPESVQDKFRTVPGLRQAVVFLHLSGACWTPNHSGLTRGSLGESKPGPAGVKGPLDRTPIHGTWR